MDSVPVDHLGGWREHWSVYCVAYKGEPPAVTRFKDSDHPLAVHLRGQTQGVVTNPRFTGTSLPQPPDPVATLQPELTKITAELTRLSSALNQRSLPERAYRTVRRTLTTLAGGRR